MAWTPLQSSLLAAVDYDPAFRMLHVRFRRGDVVSYRDVPADVIEALKGAASAGRYYLQNVRDRFQAL